MGRQSGACLAAFLRFLLPGTAGLSSAAPAFVSASAAAAVAGSTPSEAAAVSAAGQASLPRRRRLLGGGRNSGLGAAAAAEALPLARVALPDDGAACCGASQTSPPCADAGADSGIAAAAAVLPWSCAACSRSRWAACSRFTPRTCQMHQAHVSSRAAEQGCRSGRSTGACSSLAHGSPVNAWAMLSQSGYTTGRG